jgi:hypothetical protein
MNDNIQNQINALIKQNKEESQEIIKSKIHKLLKELKENPVSLKIEEINENNYSVANTDNVFKAIQKCNVKHGGVLQKLSEDN